MKASTRSIVTAGLQALVETREQIRASRKELEASRKAEHEQQVREVQEWSDPPSDEKPHLDPVKRHNFAARRRSW